MSCVGKGTDGVGIVDNIVKNQIVDFAEVDQAPQFTIGFFRGNNWVCILGLQRECCYYPIAV